MAVARLEKLQVGDASALGLGSLWDPTWPAAAGRGNCVAWFRNLVAKGDANITAASNRVSQWLDMSPNGVALTQATGASQPLLTSPEKTFVVFNGTSYAAQSVANDGAGTIRALTSAFRASLAFGQLTPFTVVIAYKQGAAGVGSWQAILGQVSAYATNGWGLDTYGANSGGTPTNGIPVLKIFDSAGKFLQGFANLASPPAVGSYNILVATYDGTGIAMTGGVGAAGNANGFDFILNGQHIGGATYASQYENITISTAPTSGTFFLGTNPLNAGGYGTSPIMEVAIFNYKLSALEQLAASQYLNRQYGIY